MTGSGARGLAPWRDRRLLTLGAVGVVVSSGLALLVPVFPAYVAERDGSASDLGLLNAAYALALFVASPLWGATSDRVGRRPILAIGPLGVGVSYLAMAIAPSVGIAILLRAVGGVFAAASMATSFAYVADTTDRAGRARAMGFLSAAMGLAFVFSPVIGGALGNLGTALPFVAAGACALAGALLVVLMLPPTDHATRRAAAGSAVTGSRRGAILADLAPLWPILAISFLVSSADATRPTAVSIDAADRFAATPGDLGLVFATLGCSFVIAQIALVGPVIERLGERTAIWIGALITAIGFTLVPAVPGLLALAAALAIQGVGMALSFAAIPAYISQAAPGGQGIAMGWRTATQSAGAVVGPVLAGWLYGLDRTWPLLVAAVIALVASALGLLVLRPLPRAAPGQVAPGPTLPESAA